METAKANWEREKREHEQALAEEQARKDRERQREQEDEAVSGAGERYASWGASERRSAANEPAG